MSFVTCKKFEDSQSEQDTKINEALQAAQAAKDAVGAANNTEKLSAIEAKAAQALEAALAAKTTAESVSLVDANGQTLTGSVCVATCQDVEQIVKLIKKPCRLNIVAFNGQESWKPNAVYTLSSSPVEIPGMSEGEQVTLIQTGTDEVQLQPATGVNLIPPFGGSLTLAGQNAVVTLLGMGNNEVRVLGQTQGA